MARQQEIEDKEHAAQLAAEEERLRAVRMQLEVQRRVDAEKAMLQQQRELEEERQRLLETEHQLLRRLEDEESLFQLNRQQRIDDEVRRRVEEKSRRLIVNGKATNHNYGDFQDDEDMEVTDLQLPPKVAARLVEEAQDLGEQGGRKKTTKSFVMLSITLQ